MKFSDLRISSKLYMAAAVVIVLMLSGAVVLYLLWGGMTKALAIKHLANTIKHHATAVALHANLYYEKEIPQEYTTAKAYSDSVQRNFERAHNTVKTERGRQLLRGAIEAFTQLQQIVDALPEQIEQHADKAEQFAKQEAAYL